MHTTFKKMTSGIDENIGKSKQQLWLSFIFLSETKNSLISKSLEIDWIWTLVVPDMIESFTPLSSL